MINKTTQVALGSFSGLLAFGFGSGLTPKAPGTFGTLAAVPFLFMWQYLSWPLYVLMLWAFMFVNLAVKNSVYTTMVVSFGMNLLVFG